VVVRRGGRLRCRQQPETRTGLGPASLRSRKLCPANVYYAVSMIRGMPLVMVAISDTIIAIAL
jgi:hypothetical protein